MNLGTLFPNEKERNEAISKLSFLQNNEGWRLLSDRIIQSDIDQITELILNTDFDDLTQERYIKRKRDYLVILKQMPEKIIKALEEGKDEIVEFDPYYKNAEEIKK